MLKPLRALLPLAALAASPALAQQTPAQPPSQEIIVTAATPQAMHDFVTALSDPGPTGQLGRWTEFCPSVAGVGDEQAALIVERLKEDSQAMGVDTGGAHCRPTTIIFFNNDADWLAGQIAHRAPVTLRTDGQPRLHRFVTTHLPVRWVTVTDPCGGTHCSSLGSLIHVGTHPAFMQMVVVVDGTRIHGYGLDEVSDYLAAVALANPPLASGRPRDSVLSMFEVPRTAGQRFALTQADRDFITGLYLSPAEDSARAQRNAIAGHMRHAQQRR